MLIQRSGHILDLSSRSRAAIVAAYLLATLLAPGLHDHERDAHPAPEPHTTVCLVEGDHLDHDPGSSEAGLDLASCLACQYRADHHAFLKPAPEIGRDDTESRPVDRAAATPRFLPVVASIRGPPHA